MQAADRSSVTARWPTTMRPPSAGKWLLRAVLPGMLCLLAALPVPADVGDATAGVPVAQAVRYKALALACLHQEYPNKVAHVMTGDHDVAPPRALTPVFYGCYDWHSAVHAHWLLARLLRLHPDDPDAAAVEAALEQSFQPERVAAEVEYMAHAERTTFERPYGIAWLLQLTAELREWDDPRARRWQSVLEPLESAYVARASDWLHKLAYPIRTGEHAQTAFAFALFLDWARIAGNTDFAALVSERSRQFYRADAECPLDYEPGGQDFLSPCLAEADLMWRVLPPTEYALWLAAFLPAIPHQQSPEQESLEQDHPDWLPLALVTDRSDGKLAHLDGLHLSRAWALWGMAAALPDSDPRKPVLEAAATRQGNAGLAAVTGEHYAGGHWLGSFATYLVSGRGTGVPYHPDDSPPGAVLPATESASLAAVHTLRARMARWEPALNAVLALNPDLEQQARELDRMRQPGQADSPVQVLHGLPVLLKDNIEMREMATTAGSLALADNHTGRDAELTRRLRAAGVLIAGKTNLSEWANFRDRNSSSGWSAVGGLTRNAWDQSRSACGSSSGSAVAVAAGYVPFAIGTETDGSIVCPAAYNGVVGIKPTLGLVSRRGIVPIASSQDTAGPMAYDVRAAALLLSAMEGEDPLDPATRAAQNYFGRDYVSGLGADGLVGLKIGVIRSRNFGDGSEAVFGQAVADLAAAGAALVDDLDFPEWPENFNQDSLDVLLYEFKHDLNQYLAGLPGAAAGLDLQRLIEFNVAHAERELQWFGQDLLVDAQATTGLDDPDYLQALASVQAFTRNAIDSLLQAHGIDLLVMPTNALPFSIDLVHGDTWHGGSSSMAAISGYPHITVPAGKAKGLPVGLSLVGPAFSEPLLIRAAFAYQEATGHATTLEGADPWQLRTVHFPRQAAVAPVAAPKPNPADGAVAAQAAIVVR